MWMSDKPLIQEELARNISGLIHAFENIDGKEIKNKIILLKKRKSK